MSLLYRIENIGKSFSDSEKTLEILKNINLEINTGISLGIIGASGSGKSTLLNILGTLDKPTTGKIFFENYDLAAMNLQKQAAFRNKALGFVFQFHHLLPEFTALENVAIPGFIARKPKTEILVKASQLLERVGLSSRQNARPATLSGGERQRVAIARALLLNPKVILADEPTGNLDENSAMQVCELLLQLNKELGITLVIVTHNHDIANKMDRILELRAGELYEKTHC